ncbi:hypothetical protein L7F22_039569 [Adiantum nelumboides]|nr:hypothetical protein [Adiantum nelumboides]
MAELLPGLPEKVALLCLARVPRIYHTALRAVNKTWREVVGSKEFYIVRKQLGATEESVFLIKKFDKPPNRLHSLEIDLKTRKCCKSLFVNDEVTRDIFNEGFGCASIGHLVIFFGGNSFSEDHTPSGAVHVFNALSRTWTKGADMQCPRGEFCYGVIDGKLYVAGGHAGQGRGVVTDAEVYDADTDSWSRIASMPLALYSDIFCVWRNKLVVRGLRIPEKTPYVFSYSPSNNEWVEQRWLLNVFSPFKPLISLASVVVTKSNDSLYVGVAENSYQGMHMEDYVSLVKVMKLDSNTLEWKTVSKYRDESDEANCECSIDVAPPSFFFSLRDRVPVMNHLEYENVRMFKLAFSKNLVKLFLTCPSSWVSTIVET